MDATLILLGSGWANVFLVAPKHPGTCRAGILPPAWPTRVACVDLGNTEVKDQKAPPCKEPGPALVWLCWVPPLPQPLAGHTHSSCL